MVRSARQVQSFEGRFASIRHVHKLSRMLCVTSPVGKAVPPDAFANEGVPMLQAVPGIAVGLAGRRAGWLVAGSYLIRREEARAVEHV